MVAQLLEAQRAWPPAARKAGAEQVREAAAGPAREPVVGSVGPATPARLSGQAEAAGLSG